MHRRTFAKNVLLSGTGVALATQLFGKNSSSTVAEPLPAASPIPVKSDPRIVAFAELSDTSCTND